jgi:hypothetical protein
MPGRMQQRGPSTWRLHAFAGDDSNGRKRYTSKTLHEQRRKRASTIDLMRAVSALES